MDAVNNPVRRRRETHTGEMQGVADETMLIDDALANRGAGIEAVQMDINHQKEYAEQLAFMEEPMTIRIEENSGNDFPETHVPVQCNGIPAECWIGGRWVQVGWLPINTVLITKRKYVEILARSRPESIRTKVETIDNPNLAQNKLNKIERRTKQAYPMSIIEDKNPKGIEWMARIMQAR